MKLKEEIDRLNVMFQKGRITEEYYEEQYKDLTAKLSELHDEETHKISGFTLNI